MYNHTDQNHATLKEDLDKQMTRVNEQIEGSAKRDVQQDRDLKQKIAHVISVNNQQSLVRFDLLEVNVKKVSDNLELLAEGNSTKIEPSQPRARQEESSGSAEISQKVNQLSKEVYSSIQSNQALEG